MTSDNIQGTSQEVGNFNGEERVLGTWCICDKMVSLRNATRNNKISFKFYYFKSVIEIILFNISK